MTGNPSKPPSKEPGLLQIMQSVLAAAFGVQSSQNRARDFESGSPFPYLLGGMIFVLIFIVAILAVVFLVLPG